MIISSLLVAHFVFMSFKLNAISGTFQIGVKSFRLLKYLSIFRLKSRGNVLTPSIFNFPLWKKDKFGFVSFLLSVPIIL